MRSMTYSFLFLMAILFESCDLPPVEPENGFQSSGQFYPTQKAYYRVQESSLVDISFASTNFIVQAEGTNFSHRIEGNIFDTGWITFSGLSGSSEEILQGGSYRIEEQVLEIDINMFDFPNDDFIFDAGNLVIIKQDLGRYYISYDLDGQREFYNEESQAVETEPIFVRGIYQGSLEELRASEIEVPANNGFLFGEANDFYATDNAYFLAYAPTNKSLMLTAPEVRIVQEGTNFFIRGEGAYVSFGNLSLNEAGDLLIGRYYSQNYIAQNPDLEHIGTFQSAGLILNDPNVPGDSQIEEVSYLDVAFDSESGNYTFTYALNGTQMVVSESGSSSRPLQVSGRFEGELDEINF